MAPRHQNEPASDENPDLSEQLNRLVPESAPVPAAPPAVTTFNTGPPSATTAIAPDATPPDKFVNIVPVGPAPTSETARKNKEIYDAIMAARNQPPAVPPVQPPIPRVLSQTQAEMEEGRKQVERHEAAKVGNIPRRTDKEIAAEGHSTPVFRPVDWAPDPKTSQTDTQRGVRNL